MAKRLWGAGVVAAFLVPVAVIRWPVSAVRDFDRDLVFGLATEVVIPVLVLIVLAATKSLFDAKAYRSANVVILALMLAIVLSIVSSRIKGGPAFLLIAEQSGPIVYLVGLSHVAWFGLAIPLGIQFLRFRRFAGGTAWLVAGILYLVGGTVMCLAWLLTTIGAGAEAPIIVFGWMLMLWGAVILPIAVVAHGVALFSAIRTSGQGVRQA